MDMIPLTTDRTEVIQTECEQDLDALRRVAENQIIAVDLERLVRLPSGCAECGLEQKPSDIKDLELAKINPNFRWKQSARTNKSNQTCNTMSSALELVAMRATLTISCSAFALSTGCGGAAASAMQVGEKW